MDKKTQDSWYWTNWFSFSLACVPSIIGDTKGEIKIWDVYCFTLVLGFYHFITKIKIACLISQTQNGGVVVQFVSSILLWGMLNVTQKSPPIMNSVTTQPPKFVVPKLQRTWGRMWLPTAPVTQWRNHNLERRQEPCQLNQGERIILGNRGQKNIHQFFNFLCLVQLLALEITSIGIHI